MCSREEEAFGELSLNPATRHASSYSAVGATRATTGTSLRRPRERETKSEKPEIRNKQTREKARVREACGSLVITGSDGAEWYHKGLEIEREREDKHASIKHGQ